MKNYYQELINILESKTAYPKQSFCEISEEEIIKAKLEFLKDGKCNMDAIRAIHNKLSTEIPRNIKEAILTSQVFIFNEEITERPPVAENGHYVELDAPFKNCVLISNAQFGFRALTSFELGAELTVPIILLTETSPKEYAAYAMVEDPFGDNHLTFLTDTDGLALVKSLVGKINSYKTEVAEVIYKIPTNRKNQYKKESRSVIYLSSKKCNTPKTITIGSQVCKLTCRFMVRGHWRKLNDASKLGKDRAGEYATVGFTWVTEHERGDKEAPIKSQVRVCLT
jgi:hypothetical protein